MASGKNRFKFTNKKHSGIAVVSVICSGISLVCLIVCIVISYTLRGAIPRSVTAAAVFAILLDVIALVMAVRSRREENIFLTLPNIALGISAAGLALWIWVYVLGV